MTFKTICADCGRVLEGNPEADPVEDICRSCYEKGKEPEQVEFNFGPAGKDFPIKGFTGEDFELESRRHRYAMGYDDE